MQDSQAARMEDKVSGLLKRGYRIWVRYLPVPVRHLCCCTAAFCNLYKESGVSCIKNHKFQDGKMFPFFRKLIYLICLLFSKASNLLLSLFLLIYRIEKAVTIFLSFFMVKKENHNPLTLQDAINMLQIAVLAQKGQGDIG